MWNDEQLEPFCGFIGQNKILQVEINLCQYTIANDKYKDVKYALSKKYLH